MADILTEEMEAVYTISVGHQELRAVLSLIRYIPRAYILEQGMNECECKRLAEFYDDLEVDVL